MKGYIFWGILIAYGLLRTTTGYLTFIKFPKQMTLPTVEMSKRAEVDAFYKEQLQIDIDASRGRRELIAKSASHSFDVVLGALLGFMSAIVASKGLSKAGT
jgi:hypothetical protein